MAATGFHVLVRSFSSSAVLQQFVKPPLQIFGLEGRYATALYSAATKQKQLDVVEKELVQLQGTLKTDTRLREFMVNPTIKRSLKVDALKQIATAISLSAPSTNLLGLLAENGRLKSLDTIINSFKMIMAAHRGEVSCEVTTAKALDEPTQKDLEAALSKFLKPGQKLLLTLKVDPSIIGGMVVSIADKYVDMSIASKVKKYTEVISAAV